MYRYPRLFLIAGLSLLAAFACTKKNDFQQKSIEDVTGSVPSLFSIDAYEFDPQGSSDDFAYVSELGWSVSSCPDWVTVQPQSGNEGRTVISIRADINADWSDRSGTLSFKDRSGSIHSIAVSQDCPRLGCSVRSLETDLEPSSGSVPGKGSPEGRFTIPFLWSHASGETEPVEISITSNVNWKITLDNEEWFGLFEEKNGALLTSVTGSGDKVLYINVRKHNFTKEDVGGAKLTLEPYTNDTYSTRIPDSAIANWSMDLSQSHLKFLIGKSSSASDMSHNDLSLDFDELGYVASKSFFEQPLYVDCELPWSVETAHFVKLDNMENGQANSSEQRLVYLQHPETNSRINHTKEALSEEIVFSAIKDGVVVASRSVSVNQAPYVFSLNQHSVSVENGVFLEDGSRCYGLDEGSAPKKYSLTLTTTGEWKVEDLSDDAKQWLEIDPETLSGGEARGTASPDRTIHFWVKKQNLKLEDIVAAIRIRANYDWVVQKEITQLRSECSISQEKFSFDGALSDTGSLSATQLFEDGVTKNLQITSSGPWLLCVDDGGKMTPVLSSAGCRLSVSQDSGFTSASAEKNATIQVGARIVNEGNTDIVTNLYLVSSLHEALPEGDRYGYQPKVIPVTQRRFTFSVNGLEADSAQEIVAYRTAFDDGFVIQSDGNWEITEKPAWADPQPSHAFLSEGDVNKRVYINPEVYGNLENPRSGDIKIRCYYKDIERIITLTLVQDKLSFAVSSNSDAAFVPATNFPYNGSYLNQKSWDYTMDASDELPWTVVFESQNMGLSANHTSTLSGRGSGEFKIYPSYNETQESKDLSFHFETDDSRFSTPVATRSFRLTQSPFVWEDNTINPMTFDALSSLVSGSSKVNFMCSGPWEFQNRPAWLDVSGISFTSDPDFTVRVTPNTAAANVSRSSTVTIRSLIGGYSKSFELSQWQYYFDSNPVNLSFTTLDASDQTVYFQCSGNWHVADANGITVDKTSGSGSISGGQLSLKIHPDDYFEENADRNAYFTIQSDDNTSFTKRVNYTQPKYEFSVSASSIETSGPKDLGTRNIEVTITSGDTWTVNNSNPEVVGVATSGNKAIIAPVANYTQSERSSSIIFESVRGKKNRTVQFRQPAYRFSLSQDSLSISEAGETKSVTVTSDGYWTLSKDASADWLTITVSSGGVGATEVRITATSNVGTSNADRTATLTLKGSDHEDLVRTLTVTQKAAKP